MTDEKYNERRISLFTYFRKSVSASLEDDVAMTIEKMMKVIASADPVTGAAIIDEFIGHRDHCQQRTHGWATDANARFGREMERRGMKENREAKSKAEEAQSYGLTLAGLWLQASVARTEKLNNAFVAMRTIFHDTNRGS